MKSNNTSLPKTVFHTHDYCIKKRKEHEEESKEAWFSWEMAGLGYPFGLLSTEVALYVTGYFYIASQRPLRQHVRFRYF